MSALNKYTISAGDEYYCKLCLSIYDDVYQTDCGCRLCLKCLDMCKNQSEENCKICGEITDLNLARKDKAFQKEIDRLATKCNSCDWTGKFCDFKKHYETHQKICLYRNIGCILQHTNSDENNTEHLSLVYEDIHKRLYKLEQYSANFVSTCIQRDETNEVLEDSDSLKNNDDSIKKINEVEKNFEHVKETINRITNKNDKIMKDIKNYQNNGSKVIDKLKVYQDSLFEVQEKYIAANEKLTLMEAASYNGKYVWRINNVNENKQNEVSGKSKYLLSPYFYTQKYGYKVCAMIYLNGNGEGLNTHLSLFIVIMKGEYDTLLNWPLKCKITFILIDQQQNEFKEDITDSFEPNQNNIINFKKPERITNDPCGFPQFCKLDKVFSKDNFYIIDDSMFIKIIVDT